MTWIFSASWCIYPHRVCQTVPLQEQQRWKIARKTAVPGCPLVGVLAWLYPVEHGYPWPSSAASALLRQYDVVIRLIWLAALHRYKTCVLICRVLQQQVKLLQDKTSLSSETPFLSKAEWRIQAFINKNTISNINQSYITLVLSVLVLSLMTHSLQVLLLHGYYDIKIL